MIDGSNGTAAVAVQGTVISAGEWTPQEAADHVRQAWQNAVESIVETGRRLIEAKARVGHGRWLDTVALLPFGDSTARKLMAVASHPDLANRDHGTDLPPSWRTLAVLAQLPAGEIAKRIESGEITPEIDRATAQQLASSFLTAQQESDRKREEERRDAIALLVRAADLIVPPHHSGNGWTASWAAHIGKDRELANRARQAGRILLDLAERIDR